MNSIILRLKSFDFILDALNFRGSCVSHSLHGSIFPHKILYVNRGFLQLQMQSLYLLLEANDTGIINFSFDPLLFLWPLLLIEEHGVFLIHVHDEVIKSHKIAFKLLQLVQLTFQLCYEDVLVIIFSLCSLMRSHSSLRIVQILAVHDNDIKIIIIKLLHV